MKKLRARYEEYKRKGLTPEQDAMMRRELEMTEAGGGTVELLHNLAEPVRNNFV